MLLRFLVTLRGTGICIPADEDKPIRSFYSIRYVLAGSSQEAERSAIATLEQEERYRGVVETTEHELGSRDSIKLRVDSVRQLSWLQWHVWRYFKWTHPIMYCLDDENAA